MSLVYPHFSISSEAATILEGAGFDFQSLFQKKRQASRRVYKVDIPNAVAVNDIEALLQIAVCFGDVVGRPPKILPDTTAVENPTGSYLSFGFSSNECTHLFLENCTKPPFTIISETDKSLRYKEYIEVVLTEGGTKSFKSSQDLEIGVITKFKPSLDTDRDVVWFICGGLGPNGTVGAAYYLARAWQKIYAEVGDGEFLCLVEVRTSAPTLARRCFLGPKTSIRKVRALEATA